MNKKQLLEFVAWQRSYIAGIDSFDPAALRDASHVEAGVLVNQWKMFVAMCHEWSPLAKDLETITGAVAALDWTVTPATLEGEEPTPLAQEVAKTVQAAIWARGEREQGTWSHDFLDLVRGVCHAIYRGHNVHEIIWTRNDKMVFPQEYKPVPPLFYAWTAQGLDRLELCPKGYGMGPGVPFPPDKFIVALNNCGPDHPTQNAVLNALVGWFGASKWGLSWFLQYCQVAGLPIKKFKCQNDSDRKKLQAAVKENPILSEVFVTEPNDLEIIQAAASGASIPQAVVLDMAERACHKLILGNTLTSDTTKDGGSRAQAEVHREVQNEAVLALGNFVSNILNAQLVPALVRKNYGRTEGLPLPEIRCTVPSAGVNMDRLEFYCKFINELGCPVSRSKLYDDCGVPIPADGDDVVGPVAKPGVEDPLSAAAAARYGADTASRVERRAQAAEDAAEAVAARWMAPVLRSVAELVRSGGSPADVKKKLETLEPDTDALAAALEEVTKGSLGVGQAVQVGADNPYGCNQYGEGWAHPHNGNSTAYKRMSPFDKHAPKRKVLTSEREESTTEEVTNKRHVGKGDYQGGAPADGPGHGGGGAQEPKKSGAAPHRDSEVERTKKLCANTHWDDSVTTGQIKEFNDTLEDMLKKFPGVEFNGLGSFYDPSESTGAACGSSVLRMSSWIRLNHDRATGGVHGLSGWKPYTEEEKKYSGGFSRHNVGATDKGISIRAITVHEYGHALHYRAMWNDSSIKGATVAVLRKARKTGDILKISEYANKNYKEFVSECLSAHELGEKLPDYIEKMLDKISKAARMKS